MKNVNLSIKIESITLTADDWNLYDLDGRDRVALALNAAICVAYNTQSEKDAFNTCCHYLAAFPEFGTNDLETMRVLGDIHAAVYPKSPNYF